MTHVLAAAGALVLMFCAALVGMALRVAVPENHASSMKDTATRTLTLIVTLTVFVLGFLINSGKGYYDEVQDHMSRMFADAIVLDRTLVRYGPQADAARELLHQIIGSGIRTLWPGHPTKLPALAEGRAIRGLERLEDEIDAFQAHDEGERSLQSSALQSARDMVQTGSLFLASSQSRLQTPILAIIALWLVIIFLGFGLLAPRNRSTIAILFVSALPVSTAIFLILELYNPLGGLMQIPPSTFEVPFETITR